MRESDGVVSGSALSARLGVSRVSIWKHINSLKEHGYDIRTSSRGYQLAGRPDALHPWEFPGREATVHYFPEVDSTMDIARELARKGCPDFSVVIAGRQNKGRGRLRRNWHSARGGLYFTVVLRPQIPPVISPRVIFCASLTLVRILHCRFNVNAGVKWPNDILIDERKICGMLSEMEAEADRVNYLNVGVGLNVNNDPTRLEPNAVSLKQILGRPVSRKKLLAEYLNAFESHLREYGVDRAVEQWKEYTVTLNRNVRIVTGSETIEGRAVDVDENGSLLLECNDGSLKTVFYGDCFHL